MDSLPHILRRYVREDNRWFQQELREWEEQFCQAQRDESCHQALTSTNTEEPVPEQQQYQDLEPHQEPAQENTNEVTEEQTPYPAPPEPAQQCEGQCLVYKIRDVLMYLLQL